MGKNQPQSHSWQDVRSTPEIVAVPRADDGLRRALASSFALPPLPEEFVRLLSRLR